MGVNLRPSQATIGGGLLDDADVTIKDVTFVLWDYDGKIDVEQPALRVTYEKEGEDGATEEFVQHYSAGDARYFVPSEDGKELEAVGDKQALSASTNAVQFLSSLVNAGFDEDQLEEGVGSIEGLFVHVEQKAQPKRTGLINQGGGDNARAKTVLLVTEIKEKKGKKAAGKDKGGAGKVASAAGKTTKTTKAAKAPELDTDALGAFVTEAAEEPIAKAKLIQMVFAHYRADDDLKPFAQEASKMAVDAAFLEGLGMEIKGGKVQVAE